MCLTETLTRSPLTLDRLDKTLTWLGEVLPAFDPLPSGIPNQVNLKAFAELSITFLYLSERSQKLPVVPPLLTEFLRSCSEHLEFHCSRAEYIDAARRDPLNAYTFILPYLTLRSIGFRCLPFEYLLDWLAELNLPLSIEVIPYRDWDRHHFLNKSKYLAKIPTSNLLFRSTTLAMRENSIYFSELDTYAVTHTIFYMTDFGQRAPSLPQKARAKMVPLLEGLLVHFWRIKNWDVMGELLTCINYLGTPPSSLLVQAATAFENLVRPDGTVPAHPARKPSAPGRRRTKNSDDTIPDSIRSCYHTTFVWILYVLSTASRPCPIPSA